MDTELQKLNKKINEVSEGLEELQFIVNKKTGSGSQLAADAGTVGGFNLGTNRIIDLADSFGLSSVRTAGDDVRFWAGNTFANRAIAPFRVTEAGVLTATGATISGAITATSGAIGGFNIGSDYIRDVANSFGLASTVTGSDDIRFWAGATFANRATAPFRVYESGIVLSITAPIQTYTPSAAGTATLDLQTGNDHRITMPAGNIIIALSNVTVGQKFLVSVTQDSVGSRTVTWFTTIRWSEGTAPTLSTSANKRDTFGFICTGSNTYDGFIIGLFI